jgi:hypothetical protein
MEHRRRVVASGRTAYRACEPRVTRPSSHSNASRRPHDGIPLCQFLDLLRMTVDTSRTMFGPHAYVAVVAWTLPSTRRARTPCIAAAAPNARRCTNRSRGTWRPTWRSPARGAPMGTACRTTWSESSAATWNAAFWPTASPGPGARSAGTIFRSRLLATAAHLVD